MNVLIAFISPIVRECNPLSLPRVIPIPLPSERRADPAPQISPSSQRLALVPPSPLSGLDFSSPSLLSLCSSCQRQAGKFRLFPLATAVGFTETCPFRLCLSVSPSRKSTLSSLVKLPHGDPKPSFDLNERKRSKGRRNVEEGRTIKSRWWRRMLRRITALRRVLPRVWCRECDAKRYRRKRRKVEYTLIENAVALDEQKAASRRRLKNVFIHLFISLNHENCFLIPIELRHPIF